MSRRTPIIYEAGAIRMRRAFTLIELLVVIAIIATLAAILFPVFIQAKNAVHRYQSGSNLRQIQMVISSYSSDFDDCLPPYRYDGYAGPSCTPDYNCANPDYVKDYKQFPGEAPTWYGANVRDRIFFSQLIIAYAKNESIFRSPGQAQAWVGADKQNVSSGDAANRSDGAQNSYALNWLLFTLPAGAHLTGGGIPMSSIAETSDTVLLVDGSYYLCLPKIEGYPTGGPNQSWLACTRNYPKYWKNIGNSRLFGPRGEPSDLEAFQMGSTRYSGVLITMRMDGSSKNRPYKEVVRALSESNADSYWDPYKQGITPCTTSR
jgi:prepilin-type N-terminal cleavage/methylation domain-containing protein